MAQANKFLNISPYQKLELLGSGAFADVYKVRNSQDDSISAAKILKHKMQLNERSEENQLLCREVNLLASLSHPAIIAFHGFNPISFNNEPFPIIVTEYAKNGSLKKVIDASNKGLSLDGWDNTKKLVNIYGIASGMMHLHKHSIVHRDLKLDNILIDECLCPLIADFGLSKVMANTDIKSSPQAQNTKINAFVSQAGLKGTPAYLAPECINEQIYNEKSDVYAFAFIVYEIMTGLTPYPDVKTPWQIFRKVCDGERPSFPFQIPDAYKELIEHCWSQSPEDRPTFEEIVTELKENEAFVDDDTIDTAIFDQYIDDLDNGTTSFKENFVLVDILNDLKINHLYVMTTIRDQMIMDLSALIEEVSQLYANANANMPYINSVMNLVKTFINLIDSHKILPPRIPKKDGEIDIWRYFRLPEDTFRQMEAKVVELTEIMDHAGEEGVIPLTEKMIKVVFVYLARRLLFIANEADIRAVITEEARLYPFIIVHDSLTRLMFQLFLRVYFSDHRKDFIHFYVYIALAFTISMGFKSNEARSIMYFNCKYPLKIESENLQSYPLRQNLINFANRQKSNKPYLNTFRNEMEKIEKTLK